MSAFEAALRLEAAGDARWRARVDERFLTNGGAFGGWTLAAATRAAEATADPAFVPKSLSLEFLARAEAGATVDIAAECLRTGRGSGVWLIRLAVGDTTVAIATAVMARADDAPAYQSATMPAVPPAEAVAPLDPAMFPTSWVPAYEIRHAVGQPHEDSDGVSQAWTRLRDDPVLDFARLAMLTDATPTRAFYRAPPRPSTASLNTTNHYHCTAAELAALGDTYLLLDAWGSIGALGYLDQEVRIWTPDGRLLATSRQLVRARS